MARNIWVTSDTHFLHTNSLSWETDTGCADRGKVFPSTPEMDETLIDNWNSVVKPGDKVYHLGDVFMGNKDEFKTLWPRLAGAKRLIVGNHDDIKFLSSGGFFQKVQMWRVFTEFGLILSHVPVHQSALTGRRGGLKNIHGHIHTNPSPEGPYQCVCVEQTNYTPVNIEELRV